MTLATSPSDDTLHDPLAQYTATVQSLHQKLNHIRANQHATAASLGRAAQALRSISAANGWRTHPVSKNEFSNLRESGYQMASSGAWENN